MLLNGKTALVTGGARGIGRTICGTWMREGGKVAFNDLEIGQEAQAFIDEAKADGHEPVGLVGNVTSAEDAERVIGEVCDRFGRLDILVNNAGIIRDNLCLTMDPADFEAVIKVNLIGTFTFSQAAVRVMLRQHEGSIVNISSVAGQIGGRGQTNYSASKGGINSFTRALASEMASKGIRVNAVAPGMIDTEMSQAVRGLTGDKIKKMIPLRRYGTPQDIAEMVAFLACDRAGYVTGQVVTVDGGLTLGAKW